MRSPNQTTNSPKNDAPRIDRETWLAAARGLDRKLGRDPATPPTTKPIGKGQCQVRWFEPRRDGGTTGRDCARRVAYGREVQVNGIDRLVCDQHRRQVELAVEYGMGAQLRWRSP